jgi:hypothetical protein
MGAYRYLVFPRHQQPTAEEAGELQSYAPLLKHRFAIGRERKTGTLVFAFDQALFDQALTGDEGFEMLIRKWQVHGCELADKLKFVKDPAALHPTHVQPQQRPLSQEKVLFAKQYLAQEAVARSLLSVQQTIQRYTFLQGIGKAMPYALIACGTLGVILAGYYVSNRMQNAERERRKETIERVSEDAMEEGLEAPRSPDKSPPGEPVSRGGAP